MVGQRSSVSVKRAKTEKPEVAASNEELATLDKLSQGLSATISELVRQRPAFDRTNSDAEIAIHESRYSTLKGYQELAQHCYGRTVAGEEIDDEGRPQRQFVYRITQANVGFIDGGCNVLARNSPIASKLVTANPGDESEISVPKGLRYLTAREVRTFDGPTSLLSSTQKPNFRLMTLSLLGQRTPITVQNIRAFVHSLTGKLALSKGQDAPSPESLLVDVKPAKPSIGAQDDPTWLENWENVHLGDSETSSLGHQFFTRTTPKQENALNNPRGLTVVEGVAGSGKTSIALGRLKFFANFATGEEREHYGLKNARLVDFSPSNMIGFVLSHSLKRYLKETATALGLEQLPIRDFQEFRFDLSNRFGLTKKFKRSQSRVSPCRTKLAWLLALDGAMARAIGARLHLFARTAHETPPNVRDAIRKVADDLAATTPDLAQIRFRLHGLAAELATIVINSEFRAREALIQQRLNRETNRNIRYDLGKQLEQIAKEEERRSVSPLARTVIGLTNVGDLAAEVAKSRDFGMFVAQLFEGQTECSTQETADALASFTAAMSSEGGRVREVTDADSAALVALAAMVADGFDLVDAPAQLYQVRRNTAAFIDEFQDFTEIEVLLMGMVVTDEYRQITLSGDRRQQLQVMGVGDFRNLFPLIPRASRNQPVFLDHNFRQRKDLRILSAGIRSVLQGDPKKAVEEHAGSPAALHTFKVETEMAQFVLQRILTVDAYATVAVIMPSELEARRWYDLLQEELAAFHRPALLSHRDDLTRRNDIHFTEVRESKGLEFDVVIVPDLASFDLQSVVGLNQLYVALSRPRYALTLGCGETALGSEAIQKLIATGLVGTVSIAQRSLN
jgi:superfamily I DNA/RNA helicase